MQRTAGLLLKTGAARRERQTSVENGNSGTPSGVALQTHRQSAQLPGVGLAARGSKNLQPASYCHGTSQWLGLKRA
jgi:hypothetical protein